MIIPSYPKVRNLFFITLLLLNLSGCFSWGTRAYDNFPKETALDKTYNYQGKVIIIGAGASGLAAAKVLEKNRIDYIILEATERYGGRLKKDTTLADFPIDLGAEWIHNKPQILNRLKGKKGDQVDEELIDYKLSNAYEWDGKNYEKVSERQLNSMYNFLPESKFKNSTWYDFIDQNFAQEVKHRIEFNTPVTEIDYSGNEVRIKTQNGTTYNADRVLITVSIGVLKSNAITFIPEMDSKKKKVIQSVDFYPGFKLMMRFSNQFYPDAINVKTDWGEKVFYDVAFKKDAQSHILGLLATGSAAIEYDKLSSDDAIVKAALNELDQIYDGQASKAYSGEYVLQNWGQQEFTLGTWVEGFGIGKNEVGILNEPLKNKVFFAGELYDTYRQLGVPAAIVSAYHSIDKLLLTNE